MQFEIFLSKSGSRKTVPVTFITNLLKCIMTARIDAPFANDMNTGYCVGATVNSHVG